VKESEQSPHARDDLNASENAVQTDASRFDAHASESGSANVTTDAGDGLRPHEVTAPELNWRVLI